MRHLIRLTAATITVLSLAVFGVNALTGGEAGQGDVRADSAWGKSMPADFQP